MRILLLVISSLYRPLARAAWVIWLSMLITMDVAGETTIAFMPPVQGIGQLEIAHTAFMTEDLAAGASIQRTKVNQSNNRQTTLDVFSLSLSRKFIEGRSLLTGGLGFLPETNIKCLRINKLFVGNCLVPDISISSSGKQLDFMTADFQNFYVQLERDLLVSDWHRISVDIGSVYGRLSYASPFLTVTNPLILSSSIGNGTVESARNSFLAEQPTNDSYRYAYFGAHYEAAGSLWGIECRPSVSISQLTAVSNEGVWHPEKLIIDTSLQLDLYNVVDRQIFVTTSIANFFDRDVTSVYLNPLTFRDEPEWAGKIEVTLSF